MKNARNFIKPRQICTLHDHHNNLIINYEKGLKNWEIRMQNWTINLDTILLRNVHILPSTSYFMHQSLYSYLRSIQIYTRKFVSQRQIIFCLHSFKFLHHSECVWKRICSLLTFICEVHNLQSSNSGPLGPMFAYIPDGSRTSKYWITSSIFKCFFFSF